MPRKFDGKNQAETRDKLLALIRDCKIGELAAKKVGVYRIPIKIDRYPYWMVFSKPAKVIACDTDAWTLDIKMKLSLVAGDPYLPSSEGTVHVRYKIQYEVTSDEVQLRGAQIEEMDFSRKLKHRLQAGLKKKAGTLNLNVPVGECKKS